MSVVIILLYTIVFLIILYVGYLIGSFIQKIKNQKELRDKIPELRKDAISKSRSVLTGQFSEQLAPYFPDFKYKPTEVKFIGKPIDFIVFKGLDERNVSEVVFVEVKSGKSSLSSVERTLRETVKNKKIRWEEYKVLRK